MTWAAAAFAPWQRIQAAHNTTVERLGGEITFTRQLEQARAPGQGFVPKAAKEDVGPVVGYVYFQSAQRTPLVTVSDDAGRQLRDAGWGVSFHTDAATILAPLLDKPEGARYEFDHPLGRFRLQQVVRMVHQGQVCGFQGALEKIG